MPYGITEAGRQSARVIERWMIREALFERVRGMDQIDVEQDHTKEAIQLAAKFTNDTLISESIIEMNRFSQKLSQKFKVRK